MTVMSCCTFPDVSSTMEQALAQNFGPDLARMIIDALFGRPLRRLQQFFRNRGQRYQARRDATSLREFNIYLSGPLRRSMLSPREFTHNLEWLFNLMPDLTRRITSRMRDDDLERLVDPRQPGAMRTLTRAAPHYVEKRLNQAHEDYERALRTQMIDMWGINTPEDLRFKYQMDQGKLKGPPLSGSWLSPFNWQTPSKRARESGSSHEPLDDYLRRNNPWSNRRDPPIG